MDPKTPPDSAFRKLLQRFGPGYIAVGLIYLTGLVALISTAVRPSWTGPDGPLPSALGTLLAPSAWYIAAAMALLAVLLAQRINAVSASSPGRVDPWTAGFLILSSVSLSFPAYSACQFASASLFGNWSFDPVISPFVDSISLFAFSYHDPFSTDLGHCSYLPPLALLTSRLVAVIATSSAVVAIIFSFSERANVVRSIRRAPEVQVAIGIDSESADFLASIAREGARDSSSRPADLVVLTLLPDRPEVERVRAEGARVVKVDLDNPTAISKLFRKTPIRRLYLLHSDAATNLRNFKELVDHFTRVPQRRSPFRKAEAGSPDLACSIQSVVVRVDNVWDAEDWRAEHIGREDVEVSVVGLYESTAQALIQPFRTPARDILTEKFAGTTMHDESNPEPGRREPLSTRHFVICGSSQLTLGLLSALSRSAYEEGRLRTALDTSRAREGEERARLSSPSRRSACVTVHLVATEASSISASFEGRIRRRQILPWQDDDAHPIHIVPVDVSPTFSAVKEVLGSIVLKDGAPPPVVIVTDTVDADSGLLGTMVADISAPDATVYEHNDAIWAPVTLGPLGLRQYGLNLGAPMGNTDDASRAIALLDDARAIAELCHAEYLLNYVDVRDARKPRSERRGAQNYWGALGNFYRQDNERPVRQALRNLRILKAKGAQAFQQTDEAGDEKTALEAWLMPAPGQPLSEQSLLLEGILEVLRRFASTAGGRPLDDESANAVFLRFARSEHESWQTKRLEDSPSWTRPTIADRGYTPMKFLDGTYLLHDAQCELSALEAERAHKNLDILSWPQLISHEEQAQVRLEEWRAETSRIEELAEGAFLEFSGQDRIRTPGKVFGQVITVLYHLDALGYLSAVLGKIGEPSGATEIACGSGAS